MFFTTFSVCPHPQPWGSVWPWFPTLGLILTPTCHHQGLVTAGWTSHLPYPHDTSSGLGLLVGLRHHLWVCPAPLCGCVGLSPAVCQSHSAPISSSPREQHHCYCSLKKKIFHT